MSNFWNKPKSLYDLADEIANSLSNPQFPSPNGGVAQSFADGGGGMVDAGDLLNASDYAQGDSNSGSSNQQPSGGDWMDRILGGMSRDELQELKYNLDRASLATQAFGVVIGGVAFLIDPSKLSVVIAIGSTQLMSIGLQYLSSLVDEYMNKRQN